MRHFFKIEHGANPKNKLEKDIADRLQDWDRLIAGTDGEMESWKQNILDAIDALNKQHPRSRPVAAHWWAEYGYFPRAAGKNTWTKLSLNGCGIRTLIIYHAKN